MNKREIYPKPKKSLEKKLEDRRKSLSEKLAHYVFMTEGNISFAKELFSRVYGVHALREVEENACFRN